MSLSMPRPDILFTVKKKKKKKKSRRKRKRLILLTDYVTKRNWLGGVELAYFATLCCVWIFHNFALSCMGISQFCVVLYRCFTTLCCPVPVFRNCVVLYGCFTTLRCPVRIFQRLKPATLAFQQLPVSCLSWVDRTPINEAFLFE